MGLNLSQILTKDEAIKRFNIANFNRYIYSDIDYKGKSSIITPICPIHGKFEILAKYHFRGNGCPYCRKEHIMFYNEFIGRINNNNSNLLNEIEIISDLKDYINLKKDIIEIKCKKCGKILKCKPISLIKGFKCRFCSDESYKLNLERKEKAKMICGDKYDFAESNFIDVKEKTKVFCNICQKYFQISYDKLVNRKQGCSNCYKSSIVFDNETFLNKIHELGYDKYYDYSLVNYIDTNTEVEIICKKCGNHFKMKPTKHLIGQGCSYCHTKSKLHKEILSFLEKYNIIFEEEKKYDWMKNSLTNAHYSLDFYLPDFNVAIECQGLQHFKSVEFFGGEIAYQNRLRMDNEKYELCKRNNINILYYSNLKIDYPYFVYTNKEDLLKEILYNNKINIPEIK